MELSGNAAAVLDLPSPLVAEAQAQAPVSKPPITPHGRDSIFSIIDSVGYRYETPDTLQCASETATLREVIIGYPDNMRGHDEIINQTQQKFINDGDTPTPEATIREFEDFRRALEQHGIKVHMPIKLDMKEQIYARDIGFVIGDTFFVSNMARAPRKGEIDGIMHLLKKTPKVVWIPENIFIEGGDIITDKGVVYMGIGQRTKPEAIDFMKKALNQISGGNLILEPVFMKPLDEGEDALHLDCAFMPIGENSALIYPEAMQRIPDSMRQYDWIPVTRDEQEALGTNVFSISPKQTISRNTATRINEEMRKHGIDVIELEFNEGPKCGGSFRCSTLPLVRDNGQKLEITDLESGDRVSRWNLDSHQNGVIEKLTELDGIQAKIAELQAAYHQKAEALMEGAEIIPFQLIQAILMEIRAIAKRDPSLLFNGIGTWQADIDVTGVDMRILQSEACQKAMRGHIAGFLRENFQVTGTFHELKPVGNPDNLIAHTDPIENGGIPEPASMQWLTPDQIRLAHNAKTMRFKIGTQIDHSDEKKYQLKVKSVSWKGAKL